MFTVWSNGLDNNGAGYAASLAGVASVDYTGQVGPRVSVSDGVCTGNTTLTSATGVFSADLIGNALTLVAGSTFQGYWWVIAVGSSTSLTLDRNGPNNTGMRVSIGGAGNLDQDGFPFITNPFLVAGNKIWLKGPGALAGDYTISTNSLDLSVSGTGSTPVVLEGYTTTKGDGGRPTITTATAALDCVTVSGAFNIVRNIAVTSTGSAFGGLSVTGNANAFVNCKITGVLPLRLSGNRNFFRGCDISGAPATRDGVSMANTFTNDFFDCTIHDNAVNGVSLSTDGPSSFVNCLIYANGQDGISQPVGGQNGVQIVNCTVWNNGRDGVRLASTAAAGIFKDVLVVRSVFGKNGGYDLNYSVGDVSAVPSMADWIAAALDCNAFYTTGTGRYHNLPANSGDLVLTASPFTSDSDFTLNDTTGAGASIRNGPCVTTLPDANTVYSYIGASAPQTAATPATATTLMRSLWREMVNERDETVIPDSVVDIWLDFGLQALNQRLGYHRTTSTTDVTLVAGTQEYDLPDDTLEIEWLQHNGQEIEKGDIDQWRRQGNDWRGEASGFPRFWAHYANKLVVRPTPSSAAVAAASHPVFRYVSTPASISDSGPDQLPSDGYRPAVVYGAYLWSICYPDSAVAQARAQGLADAFEKNVQAAAVNYARRGVSK